MPVDEDTDNSSSSSSSAAGNRTPDDTGHNSDEEDDNRSKREDISHRSRHDKDEAFAGKFLRCEICLRIISKISILIGKQFSHTDFRLNILQVITYTRA